MFTAGPVTIAMPAKTVATAGVSANPHHFPSSLANQNGVTSHVTSSQPQDTPTTSVLTNEKGQESNQQQQGLSSLANTKEKTPMCLINELARFNRVRWPYYLSSMHDHPLYFSLG